MREVLVTVSIEYRTYTCLDVKVRAGEGKKQDKMVREGK